jgi:hypothetical protein
MMSGPPAISPVRNASESTAKDRRIVASSLVLIAAVLLLTAMLVSWWGITLTDGGTTASVNFLPGSSYSSSGTYKGGTFSGSGTYASANLSGVGILYETVLGAGLTSTIAAFAGMTLGFASASGTLRLRRPVGVADSLTTLSFVFALVLPILVVFAQPWAYNTDTSTAGASCGGGSNPCNSFWGSAASGGTTATWGADVGWYLVVVASILLLGALVLFWASDPPLHTRDEILGASPQDATPQVDPPVPMSPPSTQNVAQPTVFKEPALTPALPPSVRFCPFCGTPNDREYSYCQKCGKPLPSPI